MVLIGWKVEMKKKFNGSIVELSFSLINNQLCVYIIYELIDIINNHILTFNNTYLGTVLILALKYIHIYITVLIQIYLDHVHDLEPNFWNI